MLGSVLFFIIPIILFIRNCYFTFVYPHQTDIQRLESKYKKVSENKNDMTIILLGGILAFLLITVMHMPISSADYFEDVHGTLTRYHRLLYSSYEGIVWLFILIGCAAVIAMEKMSVKETMLLPMGICLGFSFIGEALFTLVCAQLTMGFGLLTLPLFFYLINIIMITLRKARQYTESFLEAKKEQLICFRFDFVNSIAERIVSPSSAAAFFGGMIIPAMFVCVMTSALLTNTPDAAIKAFTMTTDWTFSEF